MSDDYAGYGEILEALTNERDRLVALISEAVPVVDELCAWVNTDYIGCVQVQENGEELLKRLRDVIEGHPSGAGSFEEGSRA